MTGVVNAGRVQEVGCASGTHSAVITADTVDGRHEFCGDDHGWKPLQGSAAAISQARLHARAGSPDPSEGTCLSPSGFHRRDRNEHPPPSARYACNVTVM